MMRARSRLTVVLEATAPLLLPTRLWALAALLIIAVPTVAVAQPSTTNLFPLDDQTGVSPSPTLEIDCSATGLVAAQYQISTQSEFGSLSYDSGENINDLCSHVAAVNLNSVTTYFWRAAVRDTQGTWSAWSSPTSFTTINAATVFTNMFQDGILAYSGTRDADIRGLFQDPTGPELIVRNQGRQDILRTGRAPVGNADEIFRSLLKFDLAPHLTDPNAVVNVYLELTGWQHNDPVVFSAPNSLYEVYRPWGEGQGLIRDPIKPGEVSWTYSAYPETWEVRGVASASDTNTAADRAATPLVRLVPTNQVGHVTRWSSRALLEVVKGWIAEPALNQGLFLRADDESPRRVLNIASREHADPSFRPLLVIESTQRAVRPPAPGDDVAGTVADTAVMIDVLDNDVDPEPGPNPLVISDIGAPAHGTASLVGTLIRYTPDPGFAGADAFSYTVSDGTRTGTATVRVTVSPATEGVRLWLEAETGVLTTPMLIGVDQARLASWGQFVSVPNGMGNILDPAQPGAQAVYTFSVPTGTYLIWGRTKAPAGNADSFWVSMDGAPFTRWSVQNSTAWTWDQVNSETANPLQFSLAAGTHTLIIKVREDGTELDRLLITTHTSFVPQGTGSTANQLPVAINDSASTPIGTAVDIAVLANDGDPDSAPSPLAIQTVGTPSSGTAVKNGSVIRYTPAAGFSGPATFSYTISDGADLDSATVTVTVGATSNQPPVANDDTATTPTGVAVDVDVLANDTDPDNDPLAIETVSTPANGTAVKNGSVITYTPSSGFSGSDSFTYTINDGIATSAAATVTVNVTLPTNQAPVAVDDSASTASGVAVDVDVLANDSDPNNDPLTIQSVGTPANGTAAITVDGSAVRYTPNSGFSGSDSFTYTISDGSAPATATVTLTVTAGPGTGTDVWIEAESGALVSPMAIAGDTAASAGQYIGVPNGAGNVLDPAVPGGQATYTFTVPAGTYVIWGRIKAPAGHADSFWVSMDGVPFTLWALQGSTAWTWDRVNSAGGADPVQYALGAGTHTLIIKLREDGAQLDRLLITSNLSFVPQGLGGGGGNQAPVANDDTATTQSGVAVDIEVLANDSDADGNPLTIATVGTPGNGTAVKTGEIVRYTPNAGFSGSDSFTYTVSDGTATSVAATVTVSVTTGTNQAPVAVNDAATTASGVAVDIGVLTNDSDPDNDPITIDTVSTAANGTAVIIGAEIRYTSNPGFSGTDSFTYTITDGDVTATATVTVTVTTGASTELSIEAESGVLVSPMVIVADAAASGGQSIRVPNGAGNTLDPTLPGGQATYTFTVPAGTYVIWGRIKAPAGHADSLWVSVDGAPFTLWALQSSTQWVWDRVSSSTADPLVFALGAGTHTLIIKVREDGSSLDRLLITSDPNFVP